MAGNDAEVKIGITGDAKGFGVAIKEAETTLSSFGDKVKSSMKSQAGSVFTGVLAYDALRKAVGVVGDFIGDSIKESAEASRVMAQVKTNVENAGFAYSDLKDSLDAVSASAVQLGFDDEQASESFSKLLLVTKDQTKAMSLYTLTQDLARSKNMDLMSATKLVTMVTAGNTKALKEYGIELDDTASTADNLAKLQNQVKGSAVSFADTTAGKLAIVQQQWSNIKQEVGDKLAPIISTLFDNFEENLPQIIELFEGLATVIVKVADVGILAVNGLSGLKNLVEAGVNKTMEGGTKTLGFFKDKLADIGVVSRESADSTKYLGDAFHDLADEAFDKAVDKGEKSQKVLDDLFGTESTLTKKTDELTESGKKLNSTTATTAKNFMGIGSASEASINAVKEAKKAFEDMQGKILDARDSVEELANSIKDKLTTAFTDFQKSMNEDTKDSMKSLAEIVVTAEKDLADAQKELAKEQAKSAEDQSADSIKQLQDTIAEKQKILTASASFQVDLQKKVDSQTNNIADLTKKSLEETDPIKKASLETEIQARQTALDSLKQFGDLDKSIVEERRFQALDEFSQFKEETFARMDLKVEEFVAEVKQLREKQEIALSVEKEITDFYAEQTSLRQATLDAFAISSIATLQKIGAEAKSALSALQAFQSAQSRGSQATGSGKAMGGYTQGGEMVHGGEYVIPRYLVQRLPSLIGQIESMRSGSRGGSSKTVNAPVTINANMNSGIDIRSVGREMSWELGKL